jgi:serine protease
MQSLCLPATPVRRAALTLLTAALLWPQAALGSGRDGSRGAPFVPGRVVVSFTSDSRAAAASVAQAAGAVNDGEAVSSEASAPAAGVEASAGGVGGRVGRSRSAVTEQALRQTRVLTLANGETVKAALGRLRRCRAVSWAQPDYIAHLATAGYVPDDPGTAHLAGGWRLLQWNFDGPFGIGAPEAWANLIADNTPGGSGVTVAVLDTGVAYENRGRFRRSPDFEASQFVKGHDFVAGSAHPDDRNGHGTFVAGTIAETTNNGRGLTGLAYGVKIMPVRVLDASGEGDASTIAKGVRFAVNHGAKVINLSLEFSGEVTASEVPELVSALSYAHAHGVVTVAAAGNEGSTDVPYPARDKFAIAVGASTEHGCLADYSNYGRRIDFVAPGGGADANLPTDPNCKPNGTPGRDVYQETLTGTSPRRFGFPNGYEGTSMASPVVAATAALVIASRILGADPPPAAVRWRLEQTARPLGNASDSSDYGHGLIDAATATATGGPGAIASRR